MWSTLASDNNFPASVTPLNRSKHKEQCLLALFSAISCLGAAAKLTWRPGLRLHGGRHPGADFARQGVVSDDGISFF